MIVMMVYFAFVSFYCCVAFALLIGFMILVLCACPYVNRAFVVLARHDNKTNLTYFESIGQVQHVIRSPRARLVNTLNRQESVITHTVFTSLLILRSIIELVGVVGK